MHEVYGIDIERPGCSPLHLACLAAQLGPRSRVHTAEDPGRRWGDAEELLAGIYDQMSYMRYELGGCKGRAPRPIQKPGQRKAAGKRPERANVSRERLDAILGAPRA